MQRSATYLGAELCGKSTESSALNRIDVWDNRSILLLQRLTWRSALNKISKRADTLDTITASPGFRAQQWNTYIVSCIPYPSQTCLPDEITFRGIVNAAKKATPSTWINWGAIHGLGVGGASLRGAPKCPRTSVFAACIVAMLKLGLSGPQQLAQQVASQWEACAHWVSVFNPGDTPIFATDLAPSIKKFKEIQRQYHDGLPIDNPAAGAAIYAILWAVRSRHKVNNLLFTASHNRYWLPTNGNEWRILQHAGTYNAGYHVMKLLYGGIKGGSGVRSKQTRDTYPKKCSYCDSTQVMWKWTTPGIDSPGHMWCRQCLGEWAGDVAWPCVIRHDTACPPDFKRHANLIINNRQDLGREWIDTETCYDCCPLCGRGEYTSQHLLIWCPAVAYAWFLVSGGKRSIPKLLIRDNRKTLRSLASLLHQVSFLAGCLFRRSRIHWITAGHKIASAVRSRSTRYAIDPPASNPANLIHDVLVPAHDCGTEVCPMWSFYNTADPRSCRRCRCDPSKKIIASDKPYNEAKTASHTLRPIKRPITAEEIRVNDALGALYGDFPTGRWPLASHGWWPPPRISHGDDCNAEWRESHCPFCGTQYLHLVATKNIGRHSEVIVSPHRHVLEGHFDDFAYEITFDGGAREINEQRVAGACAILWSPVDHTGARQQLARRIVSLPGQEHAQIAEAWGLRAGVMFLTNVLPNAQPKSVRIVGDNLAVIKYGNSSGRLHKPEMQGLLEEPLGRLAIQGWDTEWVAVRRRFNKAADAGATEATLRASNEFASGCRHPHITTTCFR